VLVFRSHTNTRGPPPCHRFRSKRVTSYQIIKIGSTWNLTYSFVQPDESIVNYFIDISAYKDNQSFIKVVTTSYSPGTDVNSSASTGSKPDMPALHSGIMDYLIQWNEGGGHITELKYLQTRLLAKAPKLGEIGFRKDWPKDWQGVPEGMNPLDEFEAADPETLKTNLANGITLNNFLSLDDRPKKFEYLHRKLLLTSQRLGFSPERGQELEFWAGLIKLLLGKMEERRTTRIVSDGPSAQPEGERSES
jgi:hypothetical protein